MKGFKLITMSAAALYLAVVGCVVWPAGKSGADAADGNDPAYLARRVKLEGLPMRGLALQIQEPAKIEQYLKCVDEIAELGADSIQIVVSGRQEHGGSGKIFLDLRTTPTREQLLSVIERAHKDKLRVMLMPIVLLEAPRGNEWRGTIKPELWAEWFDSYRDMMGFYADIAEAGKVELFVVGSELVSTEFKGEEWSKTIRMIRGRYKGMLTYSSNWDHYQNIPFWEQLDIIGMNSYWKLGENNQVPLAEIQQRWKDIQKDVVAFSNKKGKPVILVEVGWCSLANAAHEPWDYTRLDLPQDLDLQRRLYEGFFSSWYGHPNMAGFMMWEWSIYKPGPGDKGYSPDDKPAEKVLRDWLAKGPWEVK